MRWELKNVHSSLLSPCTYFTSSLEHNAGGKDMCDSPNGDTGVIQVTSLSPTLPYRDCHSCSELTHAVPIFETCVWRICT